jgi:hypothetical protein
MGNYDTVTIAEPRKALKTEARRWRNQPGLVHGQKSRAYRHLIRSLACVRVWHESLPSSTYGPGSAAPMAKSSTEQLAPGVFVLPGMPKPPELPPELLPPPSDPLPAPKQLIPWGIAGAVALVTLIGTMLLWMSSSGEVPVPTHLVSRLPPPTVPIVMVMPQLPPAPSSAPPPPPAPQDMMAQWWATQKPHLPVIRHHRLATFHWHRLGHSKTERPDPETLRLNQQQLPDKPDEVGP